MQLAKILDVLERIAPLRLAEAWDNVGLLLGDAQTEVARAMTCLTVTPATVREAVEQGANLVVSHHPILLRPTQRLTANDPDSRLVLDLARAGVAVYSAHTAYDSAPEGINQQLAERLGLRDIAPLSAARQTETCKLVTFIPAENLEAVQAAIFAAGGGRIGDYNECSFRLEGTGTFFGGEGTDPAVGQKGKREHVAELRLEVLCPAVRIDTIVAAMRGAHPYEEPAFDIYPLTPAAGEVGVGRAGDLPETVALEAFADAVKQSLDAGAVAFGGAGDRPIRRVGIGCGSAASLIPQAAAAGCDVLLTGEAKMHDALHAEGLNVALLTAGHYATERPGVEALAAKLARHLPDVNVWASRDERDPLPPR